MGSGLMTGGFDGWLGASPGGAGGGGGGGKTLATIYAFGLTDDPAVDNIFGMPAGNLAFPGRLVRGAHQYDAEVEFTQDRTTIGIANPPAYERVSMVANLSEIGGAGGGIFRIEELNDPTWNGTFAALDVPWLVEEITFSADTTAAADHNGTTYGQRKFTPFGVSPYTIPNSGQGGNALVEEKLLFSSTAGGPTSVERQTGYGQSELLLQSVVNGASGQWLTHWNNGAGTPAAGDGPAWIVEADGRFGHNSPVAAIQAQQLSASPVGAWGWQLIAYDGATLHSVATFDNTEATVNGATVATAAVSPLIDITVGNVVSFSPPLIRTGFIFMALRYTILLHDMIGAATSGMTVGVGNDAGHINVLNISAVTISAAVLNAVASSPPPAILNSGGNTSAQLLDGATEIKVATSAVTGITAGHVRIAIQGQWVPL